MKTQSFTLKAFAILAVLILPVLSHGQAVPTTTPPTTPVPITTLSVPHGPQITSAATTTTQTGGDIEPAPNLRTYQEVKDNFGRRIADNYLVVQVTIKNPDIEKQFLLQDLRVVFDAKECDAAHIYDQGFDSQACRRLYNKYVTYPIAYAPTARTTLQQVAAIGQNQNPRNVLFRSLDFLATMGGALTGFNFVGRDGKAGLAVFNGTFLTSAKTLLPDLTVGQLTHLTEQSYSPNTLLESKDTKTYDVFIPANQFFSKESWKLYKQKIGDSSFEALEMRRILQLVLTVQAVGVHIIPSGQSRSVTGGGAPRL